MIENNLSQEEFVSEATINLAIRRQREEREKLYKDINRLVKENDYTAMEKYFDDVEAIL
jgi:hypothetical protein